VHYVARAVITHRKNPPKISVEEGRGNLKNTSFSSLFARLGHIMHQLLTGKNKDKNVGHS
jgi:hypothetical protein